MFYLIRGKLTLQTFSRNVHLSPNLYFSNRWWKRAQMRPSSVRNCCVSIMHAKKLWRLLGMFQWQHWVVPHPNQLVVTWAVAWVPWVVEVVWEDPHTSQVHLPCESHTRFIYILWPFMVLGIQELVVLCTTISKYEWSSSSLSSATSTPKGSTRSTYCTI